MMSYEQCNMYLFSKIKYICTIKIVRPYPCLKTKYQSTLNVATVPNVQDISSHIAFAEPSNVKRIPSFRRVFRFPGFHLSLWLHNEMEMERVKAPVSNGLDILAKFEGLLRIRSSYSWNLYSKFQFIFFHFYYLGFDLDKDE